MDGMLYGACALMLFAIDNHKLLDTLRRSWVSGCCGKDLEEGWDLTRLLSRPHCRLQWVQGAVVSSAVAAAAVGAGLGGVLSDRIGSSFHAHCSVVHYLRLHIL